MDQVDEMSLFLQYIGPGNRCEVGGEQIQHAVEPPLFFVLEIEWLFVSTVSYRRNDDIRKRKYYITSRSSSIRVLYKTGSSVDSTNHETMKRVKPCIITKNFII